MKRFVTRETFEIVDRGTVHVVDHPEEYGWPRDLTGDVVELDGDQVRVLAIEMPAIAQRSHWGGNIGLLVEASE